MSKTKLISEYYVRPKIEVHESKRIHHLNPFDLKWLPFHNAQTGYLHSKPSNFTPSSYLKHLRLSLSQALVYFYPLAGRFVTVSNPHDQSCYVYVDCLKGPGVRLVHASAHDLSMDHVVSPNLDVPELVRELFDMGETSINHDGHTRALVSVQVTELKDGVFLGICGNHAVADGTTFFHFQRVWSHIFMGTFSKSVTLPLVKQPDFIQGRIFKLPYIDPSEYITGSTGEEPELSRRFFQFSPQSLKQIKAMANSDSRSRSSSYKTVSTFQSLIAFVWKCITRVRNLNPDEPTTCAVPINLRQRFNPPLTNDYFGNYAIKATASAKAGDLLGNSVGWAAALLQQAVAAQDDRTARDLILQAYKDGPDQVLPPVKIAGSSNVTVAGSTRFNLNESEFGLGKLVAFRSGNVNKVDGKVNAYLGSDGDGSVDLDICLAPNTMAALLSDQEFMRFASQHTGHFNLISRI
ncbi:putative acetyltransferase At3g50280 [Silene latifolia]|uniref:putative acetyltransferase At3g50280 n=1 Tax=Silene latifolia TaxID=37657 RepID=UPI003D7862EA